MLSFKTQGARAGTPLHGLIGRSLLMLIVLVLTALPAEAQRKAGRNGAAFLKVGVGARATAVGSAAIFRMMGIWPSATMYSTFMPLTILSTSA